jgi:hypothetical protein
MLAIETNRLRTPAQGSRLSDRWLWLTVFAVTSLLYGLTAGRGVGWQDSGLFQWRVWISDFRGDLGLALAHPLYIAMGQGVKLLFGQSLAFGLNLFSGIGMAIALANLACVVSRMTRRPVLGLALAAILSVCHTVWWLSGVTEVYTWSVAGLTLELLILLHLWQTPKWPLVAGLALTNGLGLCLHNFALLALPVYGCTVLYLVFTARLRAVNVLLFCISYLLGAAFYLYFVIDLAWQTGDLSAALLSALVGKFGAAVANIGHRPPELVANAALAGLNFVNGILPLALLGYYRLARTIGRGLAVVLGCITLLHLAFVVRYPVPDQFTFLLPSLILLAIAAGVGLSVLVNRSGAWRKAALCLVVVSVALPPLVYGDLLQRIGADRLAKKRMPQSLYRNEFDHFVKPWRFNDRSAERFAQAAPTQAAPTGLIIPDGTSLPPLLYTLSQQKESLVGIEHGVYPLAPLWRAPRAFLLAYGGRPLFLVDPRAVRGLEQLRPGARLVQQQGEVLYRITWP